MLIRGLPCSGDNNTGRRYRDICDEITWETRQIQGMNSDYANFVLLIAALVPFPLESDKH